MENSGENAEVRVRFAPSPTGAPHVGNLRTALFNWLWARHSGGKFILRVEDTDQAREIENGLELIIESLHFLGLDWDEGPDAGGPYGPYRQSERLPIYQQHADELIARGAAYYCYCTPERLEQMRKEQQAAHLPSKYDYRCRYLTPEERAEREAAGLPRVVRLAVPIEGQTTLHDFIHGDITIDNKDVDDQVLIKSDGFPTYHMAVVVDDHLMRITHVMRGDDWIPSFPKHILLYQAFGWTPPLFGHTPNVLGPDKKKLSKRHGATSVVQFKQAGYLPQALFNFLALLGWSYDDHTELLTRQQLVELFTLDHIGHSPAMFDYDKLDWMNGYYIRNLDLDELVDRMMPFLAAAGLYPDREYLRAVAPLEQERLKRLDEIADKAGFFFKEHLEYDPGLLLANKVTPAVGLAILDAFAVVADQPAYYQDQQALEAYLRNAADRLGYKPGQFFGVIRTALTGQTATPPLIPTIAVLGRERVLERLSHARTLLEKLAHEQPRAQTS